MSNDYNLREAVDKALPPEEYARLHPETNGTGMEGYANCAEYATKVLLAIASRDPQGFKRTVDEFREHPFTNAIDNLMTPEERAVVIEGHWGLTGFQWGWAVNSACFLTEQAPVPNPAILTISEPSS